MEIKTFVRAFLALFSTACSLYCEQADQNPPRLIDKGVGVSSNPSPSDHIGTGIFGDALFKEITGKENDTVIYLRNFVDIRWNQLFSGGKPILQKEASITLFNSNYSLIPARLATGREGYLLSILQLNGAQTNGNAGLVQGFEGLIQNSPLSRSCLYEYWYRKNS